MKAHIERATAIKRTARVMQLEGIFDVPPAEKSALSWDVELPIENKPWNIGLIVGPSGCGKSTIARELFADSVLSGFDWPADMAIVDCFPPQLLMKDVVQLLNSVGFSSPPSWLRPFAVLSNGEQFRVTMARVLAEKDFAVIDEFTSVVDRRVAQIGSHAIAKTVRARGKRFIAVSCHFDIIEWLQPDWYYEPATGSFHWRDLCPRPAIKLQIARVPHQYWQIFARHHYLTAQLNRSAICFCAFLDGEPVAFHSYLPFVGKLKGERAAVRGHRSVCLPDFQGLGIGSCLITQGAAMWRALGKRVFRNTGHPAEIAHAIKSKDWMMTRAPGKTARDSGKEAGKFAKTRATDRFTASFEYVGPPMPLAIAEKRHAPVG
jgi:ABC-type ATPase involved in cell division